MTVGSAMKSMANSPRPAFEGVEKVLAIDDDPTFSGWLEELGRRLHLKMDFASSFEEGRKLLENNTYHAVLADLFLDTSVEPLGLEIIKLAQGRGIPVIAMTFSLNSQVAKDSMNSGALFLLEKPFSAEDLQNVLQHAWSEPRGLSGLVELYFEKNGLTVKEREVARLILKGLSSDEISNQMGITVKTVKSHLTRIFDKCGVASRAEFFNSAIPY